MIPFILPQDVRGAPSRSPASSSMPASAFRWPKAAACARLKVCGALNVFRSRGGRRRAGEDADEEHKREVSRRLLTGRVPTAYPPSQLAHSQLFKTSRRQPEAQLRMASRAMRV